MKPGRRSRFDASKLHVLPAHQTLFAGDALDQGALMHAAGLGRRKRRFPFANLARLDLQISDENGRHRNRGRRDSQVQMFQVKLRLPRIPFISKRVHRLCPQKVLNSRKWLLRRLPESMD